MVLKKLPGGINTSREIFQSLNDHILFTEIVSKSYSWEENLISPGILAVVQGKGNFNINGTNLTLDENSFLVANRGSKLQVNIIQKGSKPVMLFFNSDLTKFISDSVLFKHRERKIKDLHDFTFVEHIHYTNASLKEHLNILIELGDSCASFHVLKADMIIRSMLDDLINENYKAIRIAENIEVVKQSTRIELYKRLSMAKEWMENNYSSAVDLNQAAHIAMLNHQHFLRLFKQAFNITPHQYITEIRINKAKELLITTEQPVSSICQQIGFESLASFSGLFNKRFGLSPVQFRKCNRQ